MLIFLGCRLKSDWLTTSSALQNYQEFKIILPFNITGFEMLNFVSLWNFSVLVLDHLHF